MSEGLKCLLACGRQVHSSFVRRGCAPRSQTSAHPDLPQRTQETRRGAPVPDNRGFSYFSAIFIPVCYLQKCRDKK